MNPSIRRAHRSRMGFTLIEIVVVLFIMGVVISMAAVLTRGVTAAQKRSITSSHLAIVDSALVQFVQQQRRLPCPAGGKRISSDTSGPPYPGDEINRDSATGCTNETDGVVPWRTLGLTEGDVTDGWDRRITYRVAPALAADNALDMTWCDPAGTGALAGTACNPACTAGALGSCTSPTAFLANKGLMVKTVGHTVVMDPAATPNAGAAFVLISAGETGGGAYLNTGVLSSSTVIDGTEEQKNYASAGYVAGSYYVDDTINDNSGAATHFDDIVMRSSVMNVISRAGLGPRPH